VRELIQRKWEVCKGRNNLIITGNKGKGFFLSERDEWPLPSGIYEIYAVIKQILVLDDFAKDNEFTFSFQEYLRKLESEVAAAACADYISSCPALPTTF
jgi:hypothetical protein